MYVMLLTLAIRPWIDSVHMNKSRGVNRHATWFICPIHIRGLAV